MHPEEPNNFQQPIYTPLTDPSKRKHRMAVMVLLVAFVLLIMLGVANVISNQNSPSKTYVAMAADHNELIRILETHEENAKSLDSQNYFARAEIILLSGRNEWNDYLASRHKTSVSEEVQLLAVDSAADDRLESAAIANRFDTDFADVFGQKVDNLERRTEQLLKGLDPGETQTVLTRVLAIYQSL